MARGYLCLMPLPPQPEMARAAYCVLPLPPQPEMGKGYMCLLPDPSPSPEASVHSWVTTDEDYDELALAGR